MNKKTNINKLFLKIFSTFIFANFLIVFISAVLNHKKIKRYYAEINYQKLHGVFQQYESDIIGDIVIGESDILAGLIEQISKETKLGVSVSTGNKSVHFGTESKSPVKDFFLKFDNKKIGVLTFYGDPLEGTNLLNEIMDTLLIQIIIIIIYSIFIRRELLMNFILPLKELVLETEEKDPSFDVSPRASEEIFRLSEALKRYQNIFKKNIKEKTKIELARQLAHDIRSPLGALKVAVFQLENSEKSELTHIIKSATQRIKEIVDNFSTKESKSGEDIFKVNSKEIVSSIELLIKEKNIEYGNLDILKIDVLKIDDRDIEVDLSEFKRVISNIINNSFESLKKVKNKKINFSIFDHIDGISLKITDNGCGIPIDDQSKIFEEGFSTKKSLKSNKNNNGIGLFHAKKTLLRHQGDITFRSKVNVGTEFSIFLKEYDPS